MTGDAQKRGPRSASRKRGHSLSSDYPSSRASKTERFSVASRRSDVQGSHQRQDRPGFLAEAQETRPDEAAEVGERDVLHQGPVLQEPLDLAILRDQPNTMAHRGPRGANGSSASEDQDLASVNGIRTEDRSHHLGPARAHFPRQPDNLARAHLQRHIAEHLTPAQATNLECDLTDLMLAYRPQLFE